MCQSGKRGQRSLPRPVASHTRLKFLRNLLNKSTLSAPAIKPMGCFALLPVREGGNRPLSLAHRRTPVLAVMAPPANAGPGWFLQHQPGSIHPQSDNYIPALPEGTSAPAPAATDGPPGALSAGFSQFTISYSCWLTHSPS